MQDNKLDNILGAAKPKKRNKGKEKSDYNENFAEVEFKYMGNVAVRDNGVNNNVPVAELMSPARRSPKKKKTKKHRKKGLKRSDTEASQGDVLEVYDNPMLAKTKQIMQQKAHQSVAPTPRTKALRQDMMEGVQIFNDMAQNQMPPVTTDKPEYGFLIQRDIKDGSYPKPRKEDSGSEEIWGEENEPIPLFKPLNKVKDLGVPRSPNPVTENKPVTLQTFYNNPVEKPEKKKKSRNELLPAKVQSPYIGAEKNDESDQLLFKSEKPYPSANKEPTYGNQAGGLFASPPNNPDGLAMKQKRKPKYHSMTDQEKLAMHPEEVKDLPTKHLISLLKLTKKYYESEKKRGNDQVVLYKQEKEEYASASANSTVLLYAFYKQGTAGNYQRKFRIRVNYFDISKRNLDAMWKSLKGMSKRDAMLSYIELVQSAYDLVPSQDPYVEESFNRSSLKRMQVAAEPLGNGIRPRPVESSFKFRGYTGQPQTADAGNLMRVLSKRIPDSVNNDTATTEKNTGKLEDEIENYRKTISQAEFARYSMMKMKKINQENKHLTVRLQSMSIKPEDIAKYEKSGKGLDSESLSNIQSLQEEITGSLKDDDSDWSDNESNASDTSFIPKKKKYYSHAGINEGPHREIPRDVKFRNSMAPYNAVRKILDQIIAEVEENMDSQNAKGQGDKFAGEKLPTISLSDYLFRLARYMDAWFYEAPGPKSVGCRSVVISLIYLHRLRDLGNNDLVITKYNVHRLFAACTLVAAKFCEDYIVSNAYWARVSGIPQDQLNDIEELFCSMMSFNFFVTQGELKSFYKKRRFLL